MNPTIQNRFSPKQFTGAPVSPELLEDILNAGRWAASCFNEQPWRFHFAHKGSKGFNLILSTLSEGNQSWAKEASVLMIAAAHTRFKRNNKINNHARYDLGQSIANISLAAWDKKIGIHQMAGFNTEKAKEFLNLDEDSEPVTAIALGSFEESEKERKRKPLEEIAFELKPK